MTTEGSEAGATTGPTEPVASSPVPSESAGAASAQGAVASGDVSATKAAPAESAGVSSAQGTVESGSASPDASSATAAVAADAASAAVSSDAAPAIDPAAQPILTGPVHVESQDAARDAERVVHARQITRMSRAIVALLIVLSAFLFAQRVLEPVNLAEGKPWRASSKWIDCDQTVGRCGPHVTRILFHTNEDDNPWFELDLGQPTTFSSMTIVNRSDHMPERAVPLIVEIGDDRQTWRELARRDELFTTWHPKFPATSARFVRVRVPRKTYLHLEAVRVHP
jgi:hypothetical protein